jgi:hypothetical protein
MLLNCILLVFYILDQNFLRATSTFLMTERLVGSSPIGISHTGLEVSGFSFLKEPGTRLKNRFCVFLDTQMSGYNLSSILEQVTTGSWVSENGEPAKILVLGFQAPSSPVPRFLKKGTHSRFRVPGFSGTGIHSGFWVYRNRTRN